MNKINEIKMRLKNDLLHISDFCGRHKAELIGGAMILGSCSAAGLILFKNADLKEQIAVLRSQLQKTAQENNALRVKECIFQARIDELTDLCNQKDRIMNLTISDGLRHRSSVAAQQMAWKRWG